MRHLLNELLFRLRAGPLRAGTWVVDRLLDSARDRRFGIRSIGGSIPQPISSDFIHYQPVSYLDLEESLNLADIIEADVLVDVGSGMGRAVCAAAMRPLRAVIGVEISDELCQAARTNIAKIRHKFICKNVRIVHANALEFPIPNEASLVFLFNPLAGNALRTFLGLLRTSYLAQPRRLRVAFMGTVSSEGFEREAARLPYLHPVTKKRLSTGARTLIYNVQE
jgi:hypothetical protein